MSVPTWQQLINDLRIPEIEDKLDRLGRKIQKKNYSNTGRGSKIYYRKVSMAEVSRVRGRLYSH